MGAEHKRLTDDLESRLDNQALGMRETTSFGKEAEMANENIELKKQLNVVQHTREQLASVERALEKLAAGTYGLCDSCGKPISAKRLEAIPQAKLCLECKDHKEKGNKK